MWRFIVGLLATVGALTLIAIGGVAAFVASGPFAAKPLAAPIVLSLFACTMTFPVPPVIEMLPPAIAPGVAETLPFTVAFPLPAAIVSPFTLSKDALPAPRLTRTPPVRPSR